MKPLLTLTLVSCLASPAVLSAATQDQRSSVVREYVLATAQDLPPQVKNTLRRIDDGPRQLLAARGYLRAQRDLPSRWSWSAEEIRAYEGTQEYRDLQSAIALVRARFEADNPGYSLYANTQARGLDQQLQRWNANASVGAIAGRLHHAAIRELGARSYPARPDAAAVQRFAQFLRQWRPSPAAPLAAPGLSLHGRSRAIDFQIMHDGRIIAPTEIAKVASIWERPGWAGKLEAAVRETGFTGPLRSPNEPWHYEYVPVARRLAGADGVSKP